jgi:anaerobic magnesium-protoporphyrin IX monomethyl ester cyclase
MRDKTLEVADLLRDDCKLLVTGGPLPTTNPEDFLKHFDIVVIGEGEETMLELVNHKNGNTRLSKIRGIAYKDKGKTKFTEPRPLIENLDAIPFPNRALFDNQAYKDYYSKKFGYTTTSVITSRGCPFICDFCSRPVFGNTFRARSATNIVDEVEEVLKLGYERIWFADDCFTLSRKRLLRICDEITRRKIKVNWECLSRVDTVDRETTTRMKQAGCTRVFFGIESGNDDVLSLMKKQITTRRARKAVEVTKESGIKVGAFFILGYPGETSKTILDTVRYASALPLDYLSYTMPYPIPGTSLYDRVKDKLIVSEWTEPNGRRLVKHKLVFRSPISETKLKFAIVKGTVQFALRRQLGARFYKLLGTPVELLTDFIYERLH